jgi:hypothetical protein
MKPSKPKHNYFYMISKKLYKKNNKVIENITKEINNNKVSIKGYINGKRINKTQKIGNHIFRGRTLKGRKLKGRTLKDRKLF